MNAYLLLINRTAQGLNPVPESVNWFEALKESEQRDVLKELDSCIHQAHPRPEEIIQGITLSGLKPTHTPCVIATTKSFPEARAKLLGLPANELSKVFRLWLAAFAIADSRRRKTECKDGCMHEWHNLPED